MLLVIIVFCVPYPVWDTGFVFDIVEPCSDMIWEGLVHVNSKLE